MVERGTENAEAACSIQAASTKFLMTRDPISPTILRDVLDQVWPAWVKRLEKHGPGEFASLREIHGVLDQENDEVKAAIHAKDPVQIRAELMDVVIAALHGIASIDHWNAADDGDLTTAPADKRL